MDYESPFDETMLPQYSAKERREQATASRRAAYKASKQTARSSPALLTKEHQEKENFVSLYPHLAEYTDNFVCPCCGTRNLIFSSVNTCCTRTFLQARSLITSDATCFGTPIGPASTESSTPIDTDEVDGPFRANLSVGVQIDLQNWLNDVKNFLPGPELMDKPEFKREVIYRITKSILYKIAQHFKHLYEGIRLALQSLEIKLTLSFHATGAEDEIPPVEAKAWYTRVFDMVKAKTSQGLESVAGIIKSVLDAIFAFAGLVFGAIAGMFGSILDKVRIFLYKILMKIFDPIANLKRLAEGFWDRSIKVIIVLVFLALACFGVASFALGFTIASAIVGGCVQASTKFSATSGADVFAIALGLVTLLVGGFSTSTEKSLVTKMKNLTALVAGGTILTKAGLHLFYLLPTIVQHGIIRRFGTAAQINELDLEDWMPSALALVKVSTIPEVLSSEVYYTLVKETVDKGSALAKNVPAERRTPFTIAHFQLLKILSTLTRFQQETTERTVPFAFHVSGVPGVGKSVILPHLIQKVFGYESKDVYYRPIESEFWNAYCGQPVVVYDEFLIGGAVDPQNMNLAKEYLSCVSSSKFQPPLASVDQPSVGIKGTSARPKVVITMNNNPYDSVPGIDSQALQRRRQFVLEMRIKTGTKTKEGSPNTVDLSVFSVEDLLTFPWVWFRMIAPQWYDNYTNLNTGNWYDYGTLVETITQSYKEHEDLQKNLMTAMDRDTAPIDVRSLIEKELKSSYVIPSAKDGSHSWMEYFGGLLGGNFAATGNRKQKTSKVYSKTPGSKPSPKGAAFSLTRVGEGIVVVKNVNGNWMLPGGLQNPGESVDACVARETLEESGLIVVPLRTTYIDTKPDFTVVMRHCTTLTDSITDLGEMFETRTTPQETIEIGIGLLDPTTKRIGVLTPTTFEERPTFRKGTYNNLIAALQDPKICGDFFCERSNEGKCPGHKVVTLEGEQPTVPIPSTIPEEEVLSSSGDEYQDSSEQPHVDPFLPKWAAGTAFEGNPSTFEPIIISTKKQEMLEEKVELVEAPKAPPKITETITTPAPVRPPRAVRKTRPTPEMLKRKIRIADLDPNTPKVSEREEITSVKDIVFDCNHVSVGGTKVVLDKDILHRHQCANSDIGCTNQLVFKTLHHEVPFCSECIGNSACDFNKVWWTSEMGVTDGDNTDLSRLPEETDEQYLLRIREAYSKLQKGIVTRMDIIFYSMMSRNGTNTWTTKSTLGNYIRTCLNTDIKTQFIRGLCIGYLFTVVILCLANFCKRWFVPSGQAEPEVTALFEATSAGPPKTSRSNSPVPSKGSRGYQRADKSSWNATAGDIEMIQVAPEDDKGCPQFAVPVRGKWILMHAHIREKLFKSGPMLCVKYKGKEYIEKIDMGALFVNEDNDTMLYELQTRSFPSFADNFGKFVTEAEIADLRSFAVRIKARNSIHYASGTMVKDVDYDFKEKIIHLDRAFLSNFHSVVGDCGNYTMITNGPLAGKILGIIVAGATDGTARSLTSITTRESIKSVLDPKAEDLELTTGTFLATGATIGGPNIESVETVPRRVQIHLPTKTSLKPSAISNFLDFPVEKEPAILSPLDPRSEGKDPVVQGLNNLGANIQTEVDSKILDELVEDVAENYSRNLFEWSDRVLTVEEAIGGIPRYLASLKSETSPGIPHVSFKSLPGKKDYFSFKEGKLFIEPGFKALVTTRVKEFQEGKIPDHIWAGYLKDELVSPQKVQECRTRIIYCGEVVSLVALRCLFGSTILRINNSSETPSAIGINQYSHDMDNLHNYLTRKGADKFIAGDYKKFDQCMQEQFMRAAYKVLGKLTPHVSQETMEAVYEHQVKSPLQMGEYLVKTVCDQKSGSLFTSIINNIVNELYMRFCFMVIEPTQNYDQVVRGKFLGDDHVLGITGETRFNALTIKQAMVEIGQTYTSSEKTKELVPYEEFEDITFLGAHPRMLNGRWTGALRKQTLYQTPMWTKDHNKTLIETCGAMIELASQWDRDFYFEYSNRVINALRLLYGYELPVLPYNQLRREVASRTASSGKHYFFKTTGNSFEGKFTATGNESQELVTYMGETTATAVLTGAPEHNDGRLAVKPSMTIQDGTDSSLYRTTIEWNANQTVGTSLAGWHLPWGLLGTGNQDNIQNMPFVRFIYWRGDVEITLHLSGNQFQQGALIMYFAPMATGEQAGWSGMQNVATALPHVIIHPGNSSTATLTVPFRYFRSRLNTFASTQVGESIGHVVLKVFSQLKDPSGTGCTLGVFSKFPNSVFSIPRPLTLGRFSATGNHSSSYTWIGSMMGRNSVEGGKQTGMTASLNASASQNTRATGAAAGGLAVELDKPIVGGGALPVCPKFPSVANTEGIEATNVLSTCPNELSRQHYMNVDPAETNIEKLCNRPTIAFRKFLNTTTLPGATLAEFSMNSALADNLTNGQTKSIPFCLQIINLFCFWRADIVLNIMAFKTPFHAFRLKVVVGYGAPSIGTSDNTYFTAVLDFSGDNREHKVVIPYNQVLEYLETYKGEGSVDLLQNGSLGTCSIKLMTKLTAPANVDPSVELVVFMSLQNVKVAHPRPIPFLVSGTDTTSYPLTGAVGPVTREERGTFQATGNVDDSGQTGDGPVEQAMAVPIAGTPSTDTVTNCETRPNEKFMHPIGDITELMRRPVRLDRDTYSFRNSMSFLKMKGVAGVDAWQFEPGLWGLFAHWYMGWAGSTTLKIFSGCDKPIRAVWIPGTQKCSSINTINQPGEICLATATTEAIVNVYGKTGSQLNMRANYNQNLSNYLSALDEGFPLPNRGWSDITLPYSTNVDFTSINGWTGLPGTLLIIRDTDPSELAIYLSAADDFRPIAFMPDPRIEFGIKMTGTAIPFNYRQTVGGWCSAP